MRISDDAWLAERFGHPVFSVETEGGVDREAIARHAADRDVGTYQARVPASDVQAVNGLEEVGFRVVCATLTLMRRSTPAIEYLGNEPTVRDADRGTDGALLDIAEHGFSKTRFHLDPAVPPRIADRIKRDWVENALNGRRGDTMLVALEDDGRPSGFLIGVSAEVDGRRIRVIDLIGVDSDVRGRGLGRAMVRSFVASARESYDEIRVGTQAANQGSTRFYERLGFVALGAAYDLHRHLAPAPGGQAR